MKLCCKYNLFFLNKLLHFRIVLDLQKNCEDSIESPPIPHIQLPQLLASYITVVCFSQLMNQY